MQIDSTKAAIRTYTRAISNRLSPPDGEAGEVTIEKIIWLFIAATIILAVLTYALSTVFPQVQQKIQSILGH